MANRKAVASEQNKHKQNAKQQMSQSRKLEKAEKILDKRDAEENGEDWERSRAWGYSIEDNERWEEKLELQEQGKDQGAIGEAIIERARRSNADCCYRSQFCGRAVL
jgi:pre-mRNA-splicing factor SYF2